MLSKSSFLTGLQCPKALWLSKNRKDLIPEVSASLQKVFDQGHQVGELATRLFPGGVDLTDSRATGFQYWLDNTAKAVKTKAPVIYEAAFRNDRIFSAMDILVRDGNGYNAYEVKSSTSVSKTNLIDAAVQYFTMTESGIKIRDIFIVHINNQYVRKKKLDLQNFFRTVSVRQEVLERQDFIRIHVEDLTDMLKQNTPPEAEIGPHCNSPYNCSFMDHCWKQIPKNSVFDISRLNTDRKFEFYESNIIRIRDIKRDHMDKFNDKQQIQIRSTKSGKPHINREKISSFLSSFVYPLQFLDFETYNPAVPPFSGTRPYMQIPFQFSLHILNKDNSELKHFEFLADEKQDPREDFILALQKKLRKKGSIIAYNAGFEKTRLKELAEQFPQYAEFLNGTIERFVDLLIPFAAKDIYYPDMNGSASIKSVLPALLPEMSYEGMEIGDGGSAMNAWFDLVAGIYTPAERKNVRNNLLEYCKLDTLAMVKIYEWMKGM